ncbi:unnamed protein product [Prunus armeniaca]
MNSSNSLVHVDLFRNNLNSSIFQWLSGTHTNLVYLDLSRNNFRGSSIPASFGNMSSLEYLILRGSKLEGGIPNSFAKLCRMRRLELSGQLTNFVEILSECVQNTLEHLDISYNKDIVGSLPDLTNFLSLKHLDFSGNNLSGRIPESIGQMSKLETIWFGGNSLEGRWSGKIPIGTQLQSFGPSSYGGNPLLCGLPLLRTCDEDKEGPRQTVLVNQDDQDGLITQGFYISLGLGFAVGFWGVFGTLLFNRLVVREGRNHQAKGA